MTATQAVAATMPAVAIELGPGGGWTTVAVPHGRVAFKGYILNGQRTLEGRSAAEWAAGQLAVVDGAENLKRALTRLAGHFALVLETPERVIATVDRVRSIPLLWGLRDGNVLIDDRGPRL